jgi:hypothetical protein
MSLMPDSNSAEERRHYLTATDASTMSESFIRAEIYDKSAEGKVWDRWDFLFEAPAAEQDKLYDLTQSCFAEDNAEKRADIHKRIGMQVDRMKDAYFRPQVTA